MTYHIQQEYNGKVRIRKPYIEMLSDVYVSILYIQIFQEPRRVTRQYNRLLSLLTQCSNGLMKSFIILKRYVCLNI